MKSGTTQDDRGTPDSSVSEAVVNRIRFSKQHYLALAQAIRDSKDLDSLVHFLLGYLAEDNPRFDRERFLRASGRC